MGIWEWPTNEIGQVLQQAGLWEDVGSQERDRALTVWATWYSQQ